MNLSLKPTVVANVLGTVAVLLVLASIGGQFSKYVLGHGHLKGLVALFFVNMEQNIPTFFSVLLMLIITLLLAVIAAINLKQRQPHTSKWVILSSGFLYMAFDEAFQVHERLNMPVRALMGGNKLGFFYFAWVIPFIPLLLILGLFFFKFLLHLHLKTRLRFLIAATIYLGGVVGIELIGGRYAEIHNTQNFTYTMIATVEEGLEMAGLIFFIWALLKYFAENYQELRFQFNA